MSETLDQKPTIGRKEQLGLIGLLLSASYVMSKIAFRDNNFIVDRSYE